MYEFVRAKTAIPIVEALTAYQRGPTVTPIDDEHELSLSLEAFRQLLPEKILLPEGRRHWHALIKSANEGSPDALTHAGNLADWLATKYIRGPRLLIGLEERALILDGSLYVNLDPVGLAILDYLQQNPTRFVKLDEIKRKATGCNMNERTLRRAIRDLEEELNQDCQATTPPRIQLIESRTGAGHRFRLPSQPVH